MAQGRQGLPNGVVGAVAGGEGESLPIGSGSLPESSCCILGKKAGPCGSLSISGTAGHEIGGASGAVPQLAKSKLQATVNIRAVFRISFPFGVLPCLQHALGVPGPLRVLRHAEGADALRLVPPCLDGRRACGAPTVLAGAVDGY